MSAERCTVCGVSGTSTYRCCGNNKDVRISQINREIDGIEDEIYNLQALKSELLEEKADLENETD